MTISGCSKDRQAGYGRAAGGKGKGYKIHAIIGFDGTIAQWGVAPMNKDERVMGERLVKRAPPEVAGYLVADGNYDSNPLHKICEARGNLQLVTPRRYGPGKGTGHRKQTAGRLRSMAIVESPFPAFGDQLRLDRSEIERQYGNLTNWGGGRPFSQRGFGLTAACTDGSKPKSSSGSSNRLQNQGLTLRDAKSCNASG